MQKAQAFDTPMELEMDSDCEEEEAKELAFSIFFNLVDIGT